MSNLPAVVSEVDAKELAKVLHISHLSGDVPDVNELRRAYSIMREMGLGISEVGFLTFKNKAGKVEVTVTPKAQTVFGKAIPSLRTVGVLEVCGGLLVEDGSEVIEVAGEYSKNKIVGAWAGIRMASIPKEVVAINRYSLEELTATKIGDAQSKLRNHMLVLRARLWRTRELVPDAIGNLYSREEFEYNTIDSTPVVRTKLDVLGDFQISDKTGATHSINELVAGNKLSYWKVLFAKAETVKEVADYISEYIKEVGLVNLMDNVPAMQDFVIAISASSHPLAAQIKKLITIEELVVVDGKQFPADDKLGENWEQVVEPIIKSLVKPAEKVNSLKSHGMKPPYAEVTWRQMAEYIDYKLIQGVNPQSAPDFTNLDSAQLMDAWLGLLAKPDGIFTNPAAVLQLAGVNVDNIKSVQHELAQIVESFTLGIIPYNLPQETNAAIQLLKRSVK